MSRTIAAVLADALQLDIADRAALVAELIASLDGPPDQDRDAAWAAEIERRTAALDAGTMQTEPWSEVKRRIEREIIER